MNTLIKHQSRISVGSLCLISGDVHYENLGMGVYVGALSFNQGTFWATVEHSKYGPNKRKILVDSKWVDMAEYPVSALTEIGFMDMED